MGSLTFKSRIRSARVVQTRSVVEAQLPSEETHVGDVTIWEREKSRRSRYIRVPLELILESASHDGCLALKSPSTVIMAGSDSARERTVDRASKNTLTD